MSRAAAAWLISMALAIGAAPVTLGNTFSAASGSAVAATPHGAQATAAPPPSTAVTIVPIYRQKPIYPKEAIRQGVQGCVTVRFNLNREGHPTDLQVWTRYPSDVFDEAAIKTVARWRFRVTDAQGKLTTATDVQQEIGFLMTSTPKTGKILDWLCNQPPPRTLIVASAPAGALGAISVTPSGERVDLVKLPVTPGQQLTDGWVKVSFCVDGYGNVTRAKAEESYPHGFYDEAALRALLTWDFKGREINGKPVTTCDLGYEIPVVGQSRLAKGPVAIGNLPTAVDMRELEGPHHHINFPAGKVTIRFCVEADGSITRAEAVASRSNPALALIGLNVIHSWQYWPREIDGKPVRTCNVEQTIRFRINHDLIFSDPRELLENGRGD